MSLIKMFFIIFGSVWFLIQFFSILVFRESIRDEEYYGTPKYIYDHSYLNVFGVILSTIGLILLCPLYYLLYFIYWLCHVGRRY